MEESWFPIEKCWFYNTTGRGAGRGVSRNHEFCSENEELCIENEEFWIENDEFCRAAESLGRTKGVITTKLQHQIQEELAVRFRLISADFRLFVRLFSEVNVMNQAPACIT